MKNLLFAALLVQGFYFPAQGQWQLAQQHPATFYGVYGLDAQNLWLSGGNGEFFHSTDGGAQLQMFKIPDSYSFLHDIAVWSDSLVLIGGGCYFTFDQCPGNIVLRTDPNGANWQISNLDTTPFSIGVIQYFNLHADGQLYGLSDYGGIFHSGDLGQNWAPVPVLPTSSINVYSSVQFIDDQVGYVMGSKYMQANSLVFRLFKTVNGGADWNMVLEFPTQSSSQQHVFHFLDAETGFVPGDAGIIYKTTDGGQAWTQQQAASPGESVHRIVFPDSQTGYFLTLNSALWQSKIYRSTNGGQNWSVDLQVDTAYFSDMHFYGPNSGFAVTHYGHIYARSASNATHENTQDQAVVISPNPATNAFRVHFASSGNAFAQFHVYDVQGRLVLQQTLAQSGETVPCSGLPAGPYFFTLTEERGRQIGRGKVILK